MKSEMKKQAERVLRYGEFLNSSENEIWKRDWYMFVNRLYVICYRKGKLNSVNCVGIM